MSKENICYIDKRTTFNDFHEISEEIKGMIKNDELIGMTIVLNWKDKDDGITHIGYRWRGKESLKEMLGTIEYVKMQMFLESEE